ncbi:VIT1/CCC1 transporter family protein [Phytomonospora sp. NPDC050363]|uniref:VIT1/CCC1 transporter family protein n=1 Tax=Phytomonospora sp. NPDC050363 TaxID=3155642 RepID=UPI0033FA6419
MSEHRPDWAALAPDWDPASRTAESDAAAEETLDDIKRTADRVAGGGIRAAVLGVNDGLVTNLCLTLGVAGAATDPGTVRLSGMASLLAGALSMAAGEWVSVRSQVEVAGGIEGSLNKAWRLSPPVVLSRLAGSMRQHGLDARTAEKASRGVLSVKRTAAKDSTRILFGVGADDSGSPVVAAVSSLLLFALGALVPLLPWFITDGATAVAWSAAATAVASLSVGGYLGVGSGRGPWWGAARQLLIVAIVAGGTYVVGDVFGGAVL